VPRTPSAHAALRVLRAPCTPTYLYRNGPQRQPLAIHGDHLAYRLLLGLVRHQLAVVAQPVAERDRAAEIPAARLLVGLYLSDALSDAVALAVLPS
jgi:hypothetical protein